MKGGQNKMINKKFMKDRIIGNILVTYQGESIKDKGTAIFYVGNRKESKSSAKMINIAEIKWDKDLKEYSVTRDDAVKTFDIECKRDIIEFLEELNESIK